jgi:hypothetical protein
LRRLAQVCSRRGCPRGFYPFPSQGVAYFAVSFPLFS